MEWCMSPAYFFNTVCSHHQAPGPASAAADPEEDDEEGNRTALQRYKMVDARLRRLCEKKGSGKLKVPQAIHDQWTMGGKARDELRMLLEQYDFDKELSVLLNPCFTSTRINLTWFYLVIFALKYRYGKTLHYIYFMIVVDRSIFLQICRKSSFTRWPRWLNCVRRNPRKCWKDGSLQTRWSLSWNGLRTLSALLVCLGKSKT